MSCNHERIKCVNCVKTCLICGAELPKDFIPGAPAQASETPVKAEKTAKKTTRKKVTA